MAKVLLYGHLAKVCGKTHCFDIRTPIEAIRALRANFPEFERELIKHSGGYHVLVGYEDKTKKSMSDPISERDTVRIVPSVSGSGIEIAMFIGAMLEGAIGAAAAAAVGMAVSNMLIGLVITGIASALFAPDKPNVIDTERPENKPSYAFNGAVNTMAQGHPVPIGYGRLRVGSQVVSAGLSVEQIPV